MSKAKRIAVYAGSFDPVTLGHEDIIRRGARMFDELHVTVMVNVNKQGDFHVEERLALLKKAVGDLENVIISRHEGLAAAYAQQVGANAMLRGIRSVRDLESERDLAEINRKLCPELETLFLLTRPEMSCISSSAVREAGHFGAPLTAFVPAQVLEDITEHYK